MGASETQVPVSSLNSFIMATLFSKAYKSSWAAKDFKPFHDFMQDRRAQGYAFPDLQKYAKDANFIFQSAAFSAPVLKNLRASQEPGVLAGEFSMPATIQMLAPRAELQKHVPYVQFEGMVKGTMLFKVVDGKLAVQLKNAIVQMKSAWNKTYVATYKPNTTIKDGLIADQLAKSLANGTYTAALPYWQWQNNQRLIPVNLGIEGEQVKVYWDVTSAPSGVAAR